MFGIRFIKAQPTTYLIQYRAGKVVREGAGLAFFYYAPMTSLVAISMATADAPFIFEESTSDFQNVSVQGQVTYRICDPRKLATQLNFTLMPNGRDYASDDPKKVAVRVINLMRVLVCAELARLPLRQAIRAADPIVRAVQGLLREAGELRELGLEILSVSILAVRPSPETARALEAEAREQLLQEADEAIYSRRNSAVEQERGIKENELNTEIAVETKKRQIRETQMDAERAVQEKQHQIAAAALKAQIEREDERKRLVALASENARSESDARAYGIHAIMQALSSTDPRILQALANSGMKPEQLIAVAFQEMAGRADKIGQLNISPDLLRELMERPEKARK